MERRIHVSVGKEYDVLIGPGLLERTGALCAEAGLGGRAAVVTDSNVSPLYLGRVIASLRAAGFETASMEFPAGESFKNIGTFSGILEFFAKSGLTRGDFAVALGGGVVGDMAGFAAGCYMRGIDYVQVPTTLLSAVDSSVGGKTAIDLAAGKNLAGLFIQPRAVVCDTDTMKTLAPGAVSEGAAEAVKTAVLSGPALFDELENGVNMENIGSVIARCVAFKGRIVEEDEKELGVRKTLNLGHTPAHGVEKLSDYLIPHGRAVGIGLAIMARASARLESMKSETAQRIVAALENNGLSSECPFTADELARAAMSDKKRSGDTITIVLPRDIGRCTLEKVPTSELEGIFALGLEAL